MRISDWGSDVCASDLRCTQFQMIGAPVGIDDQIRGNVRPGGLREDMYARRRTSPAHRVADDPAHGVTGRDRPGAYNLFAFDRTSAVSGKRVGVRLERGAQSII